MDTEPKLIKAHPNSKHLQMTKDGTLYTDLIKSSRSRKTGKWRQVTTLGKDINLPASLIEELGFPPKRKSKVIKSRAVLEIKLGRKILPGLQACHINGDPFDNHPDNLMEGCPINNIIDEVFLGRLNTTIEEIDRAVNRLEQLKTTYEIIN